MKLLLIIVFSFVLANAKWENITKVENIEKNAYKAVDFSTSAKRIHYIVSCSNTCEIYLLKFSEFEKFQRKKSFSHLRYVNSVTRDEAEWNRTTDISKRLLVLVINRDHAPFITATFEIYQLISEDSSGVWIALGITGGIVIFAVLFAFVIVFATRSSSGGSGRGGHYHRYPRRTLFRSGGGRSKGGNVFSGRL